MIIINSKSESRYDDVAVVDSGNIEFKDAEFELQTALTGNDYTGLILDKAPLIVIAYVEGENEGAEFHWLCKMKDDKLVYFYGGCDYTGWGCQDHLDCTSPFDFEQIHLFVPEYDNDIRPVRQMFIDTCFNERFNTDVLKK